MFNPNQLPALKQRYEDLLDIRNITLKSDKREVLYSSYFGLVQRITSMNEFKSEISINIEELKPYITHNNKELQKIIYACYQVLKKIFDDIPLRIKELEALKIDVIENFNENFEKSQEVSNEQH
jgi:hypothetical protein